LAVPVSCYQPDQTVLPNLTVAAKYGLKSGKQVIEDNKKRNWKANK
jgi:hypothetical protein